jgi:hypothetical protein
VPESVAVQTKALQFHNIRLAHCRGKDSRSKIVATTCAQVFRSKNTKNRKRQRNYACRETLHPTSNLIEGACASVDDLEFWSMRSKRLGAALCMTSGSAQMKYVVY